MYLYILKCTVMWNLYLVPTAYSFHLYVCICNTYSCHYVIVFLLIESTFLIRINNDMNTQQENNHNVFPLSNTSVFPSLACRCRFISKIFCFGRYLLAVHIVLDNIKRGKRFLATSIECKRGNVTFCTLKIKHGYCINCMLAITEAVA